MHLNMPVRVQLTYALLKFALHFKTIAKMPILIKKPYRLLYSVLETKNEN